MTVGALDRVTVYTDGGADPNPGAGGWGAVLLHAATGKERELSGGEERTTNNRMELTAAIRALESLQRRCRVDLFTDSQYLRKGITQWLPGWIARGWRRKGGDPVLNDDLWRRLAELTRAHEVHWHWVKGHSGQRQNERADALATAEIRRRQGLGVERQAPAGSSDPAASAAPAAQVEIFLKVRAVGHRGAWAALVRRADAEEVVTGVQHGVTANRLDILAASQVLESLPSGLTVDLYTGSDYLRNGAGQWLEGWRRRGFKTSTGDPVKNADAWRRLDAALRRHRVRWPVEKGVKRPETKILEAAAKEAMAGR